MRLLIERLSIGGIDLEPCLSTLRLCEREIHLRMPFGINHLPRWILRHSACFVSVVLLVIIFRSDQLLPLSASANLLTSARGVRWSFVCIRRGGVIGIVGSV